MERNQEKPRETNRNQQKRTETYRNGQKQTKTDKNRQKWPNFIFASDNLVKSLVAFEEK